MNYIAMDIDLEDSAAEQIIENGVRRNRDICRLEFRSDSFGAYPGERKAKMFAVHRKRALSFLCRKLHEKGYEIRGAIYEPWGWNIELALNGIRFSLGFGAYGPWSDKFLCLIELPKPKVLRWFWLVSTERVTKQILADVEEIMTSSPEITEFHWRSEPELLAA